MKKKILLLALLASVATGYCQIAISKLGDYVKITGLTKVNAPILTTTGGVLYLSVTDKISVQGNTIILGNSELGNLVTFQYGSITNKAGTSTADQYVQYLINNDYFVGGGVTSETDPVYVNDSLLIVYFTDTVSRIATKNDLTGIEPIPIGVSNYIKDKTNGVVVGGEADSVKGDYGAILGGFRNLSTSDFSSIINGRRGHANVINQTITNANSFGLDYGSAQSSIFILSDSIFHTSDDIHNLYTDGPGGSGLVLIDSSSAMVFSGEVIGMSGNCANYFSAYFTGMIINYGGTTELVQSDVYGRFGSDEDFDVYISADDDNDALLISVVDNASPFYLMRWVAIIRATQVKFKTAGRG